MVSSRRDASLLLVWSLIVLLGGGIFYYSGDRVGIAASLRVLTLLMAATLGGGLLWWGVRLWQGRNELPSQGNIPSFILGFIGLLAVLGSVPVFRPWAYEGLAAGLRWTGLVGFLLGGGIVVALGVHWCRTQNVTLPLTLFAGLTGAGVFNILDTSGITRGLQPLLWTALLLLCVGGPIVMIYYLRPGTNDTASTPVT